MTDATIQFFALCKSHNDVIPVYVPDGFQETFVLGCWGCGILVTALQNCVIFLRMWHFDMCNWWEARHKDVGSTHKTKAASRNFRKQTMRSCVLCNPTGYCWGDQKNCLQSWFLKHWPWCAFSVSVITRASAFCKLHPNAILRVIIYNYGLLSERKLPAPSKTFQTPCGPYYQ